MVITKSLFGKTKDGAEVHAFTLPGENGAYVTVLDYGCTLQSIVVPGRDGRLSDVCLGYGSVAAYENEDGYLGACIGRYANRLGDGVFELNGKTYTLFKNNGKNTLHGGKTGFDKYVWDSRIEGDALVFSRVSPDMEEGYPGSLAVTVTYRFGEGNRLSIEYHAVSDADTVVNLTNHAYFNLTGGPSGDIRGHVLQTDAASVTENDKSGCPNGKLLPVSGTPFDFTSPKPLGKDIDSDNEQLRLFHGYDHNYVLPAGQGLRTAAVLYEPTSGRRMTVQTTKPGIQLYTANFLNGSTPDKNGTLLHQYSGVCLETQYFPNSMQIKSFPSPILRKGAEYRHTTVYAFDVLD